MLKVGIVGSGFGIVGLLPAFGSIKECKVVAVCAKESVPLTNYCKRAGIKNIHTDWQALLENEDLDAIAIAVTPHAQFQIAKAAIMKGLHVFAEKPLAANVMEAKELLLLARKKKITHGIDFMFPEIPEWEKVKELIEGQAFGKLQHISVSWDWLSGNIKHQQTSWKTTLAEGGGALSFYFSHGLHYLEHFVGKITHAKSLLSYTPLSRESEAGADILLRFKGGITGHVHVSSNSPGLIKHQLIFQCEKGVIVLENENAVVDNFTIKIYSQSGIKRLSAKKGRNRKNEDERVKIVRKLATRFVDACIARKQTSPSFVEGLRVQELIEKIRGEKI
jgi:predicted dehydrogenase